MFNELRKQTYENLNENSKGKKIVLWGYCKKYIEPAVEKISNIKYIVDSDCEKWGAMCKDVEIFSTDRLYDESTDEIVIVVTSGPDYVYEITEQIRKIGKFPIFYFHVLEDGWFHSISEELFDNLQEIKRCVSLLDDYYSKKVFVESVKRRIMGCNEGFADLRKKGERQYLFSEFEKNTEEKVILDCGAYIGDSARRFVNQYGNNVKKIYSYEALPQNLAELELLQDKLYREKEWKGELIILPYAVCDEEKMIKFYEMELPNASFLPDMRDLSKNKLHQVVNVIEVKANTIDNTIPETEKVSLIKMDIEGAEYEALIGAKRVITKCKPQCAISIYHNACDYWRIIKLLKEYVPQYRFAVRHYKNRHVDTLLYAWEDK